MRVAIVGGGASGSAIHRALTARGADAELFSRATGFDILRDDATARLAAAEVIVEATGRFTITRRAATDFFTRSTRAVATAACASGARHILLSIVNGDLPRVQGYGYLAAKAVQERIARRESENLTIVRSTQWFEFAGQSLDRMRIGPLALVPAMTIQPVALDTVADVIADAALGTRTGALHEVAGPEAMTLWDMTTQLPDIRVTPIPLRIPTRYGRAFRDGTLLPAPGVEVLGPRYTEWLSARSA